MKKDYSLELLLDCESAHKKILSHVKPESVVLEVGCSKGHMSAYLKNEMHCQVTGIEINDEALNVASKYLDLAYCLDCNNITEVNNKIPDGYYDYILLADVLEHLYDPKEVLKVLSKKMKINGKIIVSIPNASHNLMLMSLLRNDFTYQDLGFFDNTHIKWFTSDTFSRMVKDLDLVVELHDYIYMTPEYEAVNHNRYEEFGLFEKEVLLRHKNGHFFQNIFIISKNAELNSISVQNIDAYWFDYVQFYGGDSNKKIDVFDSIVNISILANDELIIGEELKIVPTMRLRGLKNINLTYIDNGQCIPIDVINGYEIDNVVYSFSDMLIKAQIDPKRALNLSFEYVDINEEILKYVFKLGSKCKLS